MLKKGLYIYIIINKKMKIYFKKKNITINENCFQECCRKAFSTPESSPGASPLFLCQSLVKNAAELSEVEVLQVYSAQCACEQVEILFGEIHRAVQGALQAG